jgi:hypothetical protein
MALPDYSDLFRSAVNIDATYYANLLKMSREVATSYTLSAALTDLLSRPKFEVGEMFEVAKATAAFAEQEGAGAEAEILAEATAEAEAVARNPTQEDLLVAVQRLHERIDENERQRREDRRDDMTRNDVLLAYTLLYTFYIALYFYLLGLYKP